MRRIDSGSLSDFVIYSDESGDHGLRNIDPDYPLFVLAFIIMRREDYIAKITPDLQRLKFKYWGHDQIIFHERDIRKKVGPFSILTDSDTLKESMSDLTSFIQDAPFKLCVTIIDKKRLTEKYINPWNPYHLSLGTCMEMLLGFLIKEGQKGKMVPIIFESRGNNEDNELELEFRRIRDNDAQWGYKEVDFQSVDFGIFFAKKASNSTGLQLADLVARPCGLKYLRPLQLNRSYEILKSKIFLTTNGWKVFP